MTSPLVLMDFYGKSVGRLRTNVGRDLPREEFNLPVWMTNKGTIMSGLPVTDPRHSSDMLYVEFTPVDALDAIAHAARHRQT